MINNALVWNGNCSVYMQGKPCFYELINYSDEPKEIWKYSEQIYQLLVRRFAESVPFGHRRLRLTGEVTANDLTKALAQKHIRYAMEA